MGRPLSKKRNYTPFGHSPKYIRAEWNHVSIFHIWRDLGYPDMGMYGIREKLIDWCNENVKGQWAINELDFYLSEDEDAMALKLTWL